MQHRRTTITTTVAVVLMGGHAIAQGPSGPVRVIVFASTAPDGFTDGDSPHRQLAAKRVTKELGDKNLRVVPEIERHDVAVAIIGAHEGVSADQGAIALPLFGGMTAIVPTRAEVFTVAASVYVGDVKRQFERTGEGGYDRIAKLVAKDIRAWIRENDTAIRAHR